MTSGELFSFLRRHRHAVQASVTPSGAPQAALVGVAVTEALELVFDTPGGTRKAANLRLNPRVAFVLGGDDATVQYLVGDEYWQVVDKVKADGVQVPFTRRR